MASKRFSVPSRQVSNTPETMPPRRERNLLLGFRTISFLMVVMGLFAFRVPDQQKQLGDWVMRTHEVLNQLETLSNHLTEAETGQRGYLLTGQTKPCIGRRHWAETACPIRDAFRSWWGMERLSVGSPDSGEQDYALLSAIVEASDNAILSQTLNEIITFFFTLPATAT